MSTSGKRSGPSGTPGNAVEIMNLTKRYPIRGQRLTPASRGALRQHALGLFARVTGPILANGPYFEALRGVNLTVRQGEVFGLVGPNGAGKSTLIKILCALVTHDDGEALVNGFDVKKQRHAVLKSVQAVLPEGRGFVWRLSARQNLEFYASLYGLKGAAARKRIDYLLETVGLKERGNQEYQRYSTGMQRKLQICRALLRDAACFLFDEPTSGLDPSAAMEFRQILRDRLAGQQGKTVLLTTHNLAEVQNICDRVAIIDHGKIIACDTPAHIQRALLDEHVFAFTLVEAASPEEQRQFISALEKLPGVRAVKPDHDIGGRFTGLSVHAERTVVLSDVLDLWKTSGIRIAAINTIEPTLEDAFVAITARRDADTDRGYDGATMGNAE